MVCSSRQRCGARTRCHSSSRASAARISCPGWRERCAAAPETPPRRGARSPHPDSRMKRFASIALVATVLLAGCDGFKEAMTAHVDTVARAGSQELSVARLAQMMGSTPEVPISNETARAIAEVWVNYQLLAQAAARGDSLN